MNQEYTEFDNLLGKQSEAISYLHDQDEKIKISPPKSLIDAQEILRKFENFVKEFIDRDEKIKKLIEIYPNDEYFQGKNKYNPSWKSTFVEKSESVRNFLTILIRNLEKTPNPMENLQGLKSEIEELRRLINQNNSKNSDSTSMSSLVNELKLSRAAIQFPKFPTQNLVLSYREYRQMINSYLIVNDKLPDPLKIHLLKESCANTEAMEILKLHSLSQVKFDFLLELLDARFSITRGVADKLLSKMQELEHKPESVAAQLKKVLDTTRGFTSTIKSLASDALKSKGFSVFTNELLYSKMLDIIIFALALRGFSDSVASQICTSMKLDNRDVPSLEEFIKTLEQRLAASSTGSGLKKPPSKPKQPRIISVTVQKNKSQNFSRKSTKPNHSYRAQFTSKINFNKCVICGEKSNHRSLFCNKLMSSSVSPKEKFDLLKKSKSNLCFSCLSNDYKLCNCSKNKPKCKLCQAENHHQYLCYRFYNPPSKNANVVAHVMAKNSERNPVKNFTILGTANVVIKSGINDSFLPCRLMVDDCSQISLISRKLVKQLNLPTEKTYIEMMSFNGSKLPTIKEQTNICIKGLHSDQEIYMLDVGIIDKFQLTVPSERFNVNLPAHIQLADENFNTPGEIQLLLSGSDWCAIKLGKFKKIDQLMLTSSPFGWIVQGSIPISKDTRICSAIAKRVDYKKIQEDLNNLFSYKPDQSEDDNYLDEVFKKMIKRDEKTQRYIVPLLLKSEVDFGNSYNLCLKRNARVFSKMPQEYRTIFEKIIDEYLEKGIISEVDKNAKARFYAPSQIVIKPNSTTSPVRWTLDLSSRSENGKAPNQYLYVGRKLLGDIRDRLLKFRQYSYCVISDICAMYLNILVDEASSSLQHTIVNFPDQEPRHFKFNALSFGSSQSPYLAIAVLRHLAEEYKDEFPLAAQIIKECSFVDDICFSTSEECIAIEIIKQLSALLAKAGFKLHKIQSNTQNIQNTIPTEMAWSEDMGTPKVLGLIWDNINDFMTVKIPPYEEQSTMDVRTLLSLAARCYDPLQYLAPAFVYPKITMQAIWREQKNIRWKENVSPQILNDMNKWLAAWKDLKIEIPRSCNFDLTKRQSIHIYADASSQCCAASAYLRTEYENKNEADFLLIMAKSKIAPIVHDTQKIQTVPRNELIACLLACDLYILIKNAWKLPENFAVKFYTDSTITLCNLVNKRVLETFWENRIAKIKKLTNVNDWYHCPSRENLADLATRPLLPNQINFNIWIYGDEIAKSSDIYLRKSAKEFIAENHSNEEDITENCKIVATNQISQKTYNDVINEFNLNKGIKFPFIRKFRNFRKTIFIAQRFLLIVQLWLTTIGKQFFDNKTITINDSKIWVLRQEQQEFYKEEYEKLKNNQEIKDGLLKNHAPFLSSDGLIRISTRLVGKYLTNSYKYPIALPQASESLNTISYQLIHTTHLDLFHGHTQHVFAVIRENYFIPYIKSKIRNYIKKCLQCFSTLSKSAPQLMGAREITEFKRDSFPVFKQSTIDLFGPVILDNNEKAYGMIIGCLITGAIHIELLLNCSCNEVLRGLRVFFSLRGSISELYSDNASYFHRGNEVFKELNEIHKNVEGLGIQWKFRPPYLSSLTGKVENMVKNVKTKLKPIIAKHKLSAFELQSILHEISGSLNSRPLFHSRFDSTDDQVITVQHLLGNNCSFQYGPIFEERQDTPLSHIEAFMKRKEILNEVWDSFWQLLVNELTNYQKWNKKQRNFKVDDFVLLRSMLPRHKWNFGIVCKTYPGEDGLVRLVDVQTSQGIVKKHTPDIILIPFVQRNNLPSIDEEEYKKGENENDEKQNEFGCTNDISEKSLSKTEEPEEKEQEINKKSEKDEPKNEDTIRRSDRLRNKNKINYKHLLTMLIFCMISPQSSALKPKSTMQINQVYATNTSPLLVYGRELLYWQEGIVNVRLMLNVKPSMDVQYILEKYYQLNFTCNQHISKMHYCHVMQTELQAKVLKTLSVIQQRTGDRMIIEDNLNSFKRKIENTELFKFIEESDLMTNFEAPPQIEIVPSEPPMHLLNRKRRDEDGYFWSLLKNIFGIKSSQVANEVTKEMMVHMINTIQKQEQILLNNEQKLMTAIGNLKDDIDISANFTATDRNNLRKQNAMEIFISLMRIKTSAYQHDCITLNQLRKIVKQVNLNLGNSDHHVLPIRVDKLINLATFEYQMMNEYLEIILTLPLVGQTQFAKISVYQVPINNDTQIIELKTNEYILNGRAKLYIDPRDAVITQIEPKQGIIRSGIVHKINNQSACILRILVDEPNVNCTQIPLPQKYNKFYQLDGNNLFYFISNLNKTLTCGNKKEYLNQTSGLIQLDSNCKLTAGNLIINGKKNHNTTSSLALVDAEDVKFEKSQLHHPSTFPLELLDQLNQEEYQATLSLFTKDTFSLKWYHIVLAIVIILIAMLLASTITWFCVKFATIQLYIEPDIEKEVTCVNHRNLRRSKQINSLQVLEEDSREIEGLREVIASALQPIDPLKKIRTITSAENAELALIPSYYELQEYVPKQHSSKPIPSPRNSQINLPSTSKTPNE